MPTPAELAWLAGILDGEGSVTLGYEKRRSLYNSMIHIVNTDEGILNESLRIINGLGVKTSVTLRPLSANRFGDKPIYQIQISSHDSLILFIEAVIPYLFSFKRAKAELMLEFVRLRQGKSKNVPNSERGYSEQEVDMAEKIRSIRS